MKSINLGTIGSGGASTFTELTDTPNTLQTLSQGTNKMRVNLQGTAVEFFDEEDDSGGETLSFTFLERISNIGATQGVASDGKYLYVTGFPFGYANGHDYIMKYDKQGNLITENPTATTDGTLVATQVNSMDIRDGKLYVSANNYANPQVPAAASAIKVFSCEDLSFIEEFPVRNNICEGYSWYDGSWWGVYNDLMICSQRDENFNLIAEHPLTYTVNGNFKYQGIVWIDNYILCNVHDGAGTTQFLDVYQWDGTNFNEVRRIDPINKPASGQGIFKEPGKNILWWAERYFPASNGTGATGTSNVVKTRINYLVPSTNN